MNEDFFRRLAKCNLTTLFSTSLFFRNYGHYLAILFTKGSAILMVFFREMVFFVK
jgi:hypothetical protein